MNSWRKACLWTHYIHTLWANDPGKVGDPPPWHPWLWRSLTEGGIGDEGVGCRFPLHRLPCVHFQDSNVDAPP